MLRLLCGKSIINFVCVYAPQPGLSAEEKYRFYQQLLVLVPSVAPSETRMTSMVMLVSIAMVSVDIRVVIANKTAADILHSLYLKPFLKKVQ